MEFKKRSTGKIRGRGLASDFATVERLIVSEPQPTWRGFEQRVVPWFLKHDRSLGISKYWPWDEWPARRKHGYQRQDVGIDGVAETTGGELWAIQAKFSDDPHTQLTWTDLATFFGHAARPSRRVFHRRVVVTNTWRPNATAQKQFDANPDTLWLGRRAFLDAELDWSALDTGKSPHRPPRSLRPHQQEALAAIQRSLRESPRTQVRMACGTGKTLTALRLKEAQKAKRTLVLVPTISLVRQTLRTWTADARDEFNFIAVCSDKTVSQQDSPTESAGMEALAPTTDPVAIARFLRQRDRDLVVFATYQSSPRVAAAQRQARVPAFDLIICDEAHKTAGTRRGGPFRIVLDEDRLRRKRVVFMTATPRIYSAAVKAAVDEWDLQIASMDDELTYGPIAFNLSFGEAIARGLLADYQVAVIAVSSEEAMQAVANRAFLQVDEHLLTAETAATFVALGKAIRRFGLRKIISFHGRVNTARRFAEDSGGTGAPEVLRALGLQPDGGLWSEHVSGVMSALERGEILSEFEHTQQTALLSNARCLTEGIDVPDVDAVAFMEPRRSHVDITQAVGRALRTSNAKEVGTILLPIFVPEGANAAELVETSEFAQIADVLLALRAHDDRLSKALNELRTQLGERPSRTARDEAGFLATHVFIDLPARFNAKQMLATIDARLVRLSTSHLHETLGLLRRYVAQHGWARFRADTVFEGVHLGRWVVNRRRDHKLGRLRPWLRAELEGIQGWTWDALEERYREVLALLREFLSQGGWEAFKRADTTYKGEDLGDWVANRRQDFKKRRLEPWVVDELERIPGWSWNPLDAERRRKLDLVKSFAAARGIEKMTARTSYRGEKIGVFISSLKRWRTAARARAGDNPFPKWIEDELSAIPGFTWDPFADEFARKLALLTEYAERRGLDSIRGTTVYRGVRLGSFVEVLRATKRGKKMGRTRPQELSAERIAALESIPGWSWDPQRASDERKLAALTSFIETHGVASLRQTTVHGGVQIGVFVNQIRSASKRPGHLTKRDRDWLIAKFRRFGLLDQPSGRDG